MQWFGDWLTGLRQVVADVPTELLVLEGAAFIGSDRPRRCVSLRFRFTLKKHRSHCSMAAFAPNGEQCAQGETG